MDKVIPLLVAFVGAGVGTYFAFLKTRRERLWIDRYEALRDVVMSLEVLQTYWEATYMEDMGVPVVAATEKERLEADWPNARRELRQNIAKMRLLFKEEQIKRVVALHSELKVAFYDLYQSDPPDYPENCEAIGKKAEEMIEEVVGVAQKYCL